MSSVAPAVEPVAPAPVRTSALAAMVEHTRYVLAENRVTAFAFGLLIVILFAALNGFICLFLDVVKVVDNGARNFLERRFYASGNRQIYKIFVG